MKKIILFASVLIFSTNIFAQNIQNAGDDGQVVDQIMEITDLPSTDQGMLTYTTTNPDIKDELKYTLTVKYSTKAYSAILKGQTDSLLLFNYIGTDEYYAVYWAEGRAYKTKFGIEEFNILGKDYPLKEMELNQIKDHQTKWANSNLLLYSSNDNAILSFISKLNIPNLFVNMLYDVLPEMTTSFEFPATINKVVYNFKLSKINNSVEENQVLPVDYGTIEAEEIGFPDLLSKTNINK